MAVPTLRWLGSDIAAGVCIGTPKRIKKGETSRKCVIKHTCFSRKKIDIKVLNPTIKLVLQ